MVSRGEQKRLSVKGCTEKQMTKPAKTIEKLRTAESATIVAIGDSLTYGWMVRKGYLDFLQGMLTEKYPKNGFRLINKGIPGDTAWAWMVNLEHTYFVSTCLDIGQSQMEPHGHGWPITANIHEWKWTCK